MRLAALVGVLGSWVLLTLPVHAQQSATETVPRVVRLTGTFSPSSGQTAAPVEPVSLSIFADETGGSPLWEETQNVPIDSTGHYTLLLGASRPEGLPLELFVTGDARWLEIRFERAAQADLRRVRLTSVPYALRAADAETLGGKPASAYALAEPPGATTGVDGTTETVVSPQVVLAGTPNRLAKYVNTVDVGDSAVYEASGSVGIGTITPLDALHVRFTNTTGAMTGVAVQNLGSTSTSYSGMLFYDQTGALGQFQGFNNSTHEYRINNIASGGTINFMIGGTSRFFVGNSGAIGIGTTSPAVAFETARTGLANSFFTSYVNGSTATFIDGRHARGTIGSPIAVQSNDELASFGGQGHNSSGFVRSAFISMVASETFSVAANGTRITFSTTPIGSVSPTLRMTIEDSGDVGIGTATPADRLQVVGDLRVGTSGTNGCVKRFDGTGLVGVCASDARLKRNITPFGPVLGAVARLQPVHYYWRAAEFPDRHFGDTRAYGLVAQDVEQVLPDLVVTNDDGYKAVDYSKLPLLAIQAIRELKAANDGMQATIAGLQTEKDELRARLTALEQLVSGLASRR